MASNLPRTTARSALATLKKLPKDVAKLKKVDPRERYVVLFPGGESVYPKIGFKLLNIKPAEDVYFKASELVKKDMFKLCLEATMLDFDKSAENSHLAAFVTSHATMAKLAHEKEHVIQYIKAAGGFGIGFINSLVFSGAMTFEDGLELVQKQAQAIDKAAQIVPSAKLKILFKPATRKQLVCRTAIEHCIKGGIPEEIAVCSVSKQTHPHVVEICGHQEAIEFLEREGTRLFDFRYCRRLRNKNIGLHTNLMAPVQNFIKVFLESKLKENPDYLKEPQTCSVYSTTSGYRLRSLKDIKKDLASYSVAPQKTEQLIHCLFDRPKTLPQPNIFVFWDKKLMKNLGRVCRPAMDSAKLVEA